MLSYLGPEGTYSERAAQFFGGLLKDTTLVAYESISAVLDAAERGEVDAAVAPLENSIEGSVLVTLDRLASSPLTMRGEVTLPIRNVVFAMPGATPEGIRQVWSHPQPLAQCRETLRVMFPNARPVDAPSTAYAVRHVAEAQDLSLACVAGLETGLAAGLAIMKEDAQDAAGNATRFALLTLPESSLFAPTARDLVAVTAEKTSLLLALGDDHPGALFTVLKVFAQHAVNLTKLESRPTRKGLGSYHFYIDVAGLRDVSHVSAALREIEQISDFSLQDLGSYPCYALD